MTPRKLRAKSARLRGPQCFSYVDYVDLLRKHGTTKRNRPPAHPAVHRQSRRQIDATDGASSAAQLYTNSCTGTGTICSRDPVYPGTVYLPGPEPVLINAFVCDCEAVRTRVAKVQEEK